MMLCRTKKGNSIRLFISIIAGLISKKPGLVSERPGLASYRHGLASARPGLVIVKLLKVKLEIVEMQMKFLSFILQHIVPKWIRCPALFLLRQGKGSVDLLMLLGSFLFDVFMLSSFYELLKRLFT